MDDRSEAANRELLGMEGDSRPGIGSQEFQITLDEAWLRDPVMIERGDIRQNPVTGDYFRVNLDSNYTPHYERIQPTALPGNHDSGGYVLTTIGGTATWTSPSDTYQIWETNQNYQTIPWAGTADSIPKKTTKKSFLELITLTKENDKTKEGNS